MGVGLSIAFPQSGRAVRALRARLPLESAPAGLAAYMRHQHAAGSQWLIAALPPSPATSARRMYLVAVGHARVRPFRARASLVDWSLALFWCLAIRPWNFRPQGSGSAGSIPVACCVRVRLPVRCRVTSRLSRSSSLPWLSRRSCRALGSSRQQAPLRFTTWSGAGCAAAAD